MSTRDKLTQLIDSLPPEKQEGLLGVVENYVSAQYDFEEEFEEMPEEWKQRLEKSRQDAKEGRVRPYEEFRKELRKRYELDD
ncbi:MAG: hypothetical protein K2X48_13760 [Chitinophagaceae bacterium]|nr:hypothetical protein [Chitinophagaceae bacterium]